MTRRISLLAPTIIVAASLSQRAMASSVSVGGGEFEAVFNGIAALAILVSAGMIYLGYRLMVRGVSRAQGNPRHERLSISTKVLRLAFSTATPGMMFAVLGSLVMIFAVMGISQ